MPVNSFLVHAPKPEHRTYIGTYGKTQSVYKQWIASGRDQKFYEQFIADITLHQTAKKHFNELGYGKGKKLPSINMPNRNGPRSPSGRKKSYSGYHELKDRRMDLLMAKDNVERFLGINRYDCEQKRNHSHAL